MPTTYCNYSICLGASWAFACRRNGWRRCDGEHTLAESALRRPHAGEIPWLHRRDGITLALGIGANTAIFSVVYSALLRQLPYYQPEKLFKLAESRQQHPSADLSDTAASYPDFLDWKRTAKSFQALAASSGDAFTLTGNGDPKLTNAAQATTNFFSTLGVKPVLGRDFIDGDQQYDSPRVAMLTYALWRSEFGGDPMVIGRTIRLDDKPATAIGILPKNFEYAPREFRGALGSAAPQ